MSGEVIALILIYSAIGLTTAGLYVPSVITDVPSPSHSEYSLAGVFAGVVILAWPLFYLVAACYWAGRLLEKIGKGKKK